MKKAICAALLLSLVFYALLPPPLSAQQMPKKDDKISPPPQKQGEDDVVRISTDLVRVDAVVTDKNGNQITDLTAADFELFQDGKPQKITGFSYVDAGAPGSAANAEKQKIKSDKNAPAPPPVRITPGNLGRILTFIVDDGNCFASRTGMRAAREGLEKFVKEQMQPNDVVAIYQTRSGSALLQQYTSDKTRLMRIIRKIQWYPTGGTCGDAGGEFFQAARVNAQTGITSSQNAQTFENEADRKRRESIEDYSRDAQVVGTIGVARYVVSGLQRIGGRKAVFLLSDGLPISGRDKDSSTLRALDAMRDLTDLANRASVIFHTIDVRGVFDATMIDASDEVLPTAPNATSAIGTDAIRAQRKADSLSAQDGLFFLAQETGGNFYQNSNYLDAPIRKALNLEKGFYLLAYQPDDETFKGRKFHNIEIKLKRTDLKVRSRAGFYGVTDESLRPKKRRSADSELYDALAAPLPNADINVRLSAFFANTPTEGNFVRALAHIDGNDISFTDNADGTKKAVFDIVAVTLNEKNELVDEFNRTHTLPGISAAKAAEIQRNGLIYNTDVPVKKAGTYTFRVALRDALAKRIGSSSQTIEVPDLKKGNLFLSGLIMSGVDGNGKFAMPEGAKADKAFTSPSDTFVPAIRRFRAGLIVAYAYTLYNAQIDKATSQSRISVQVNLYRDGEIISEGKPEEVKFEKQLDGSRITDSAYLRLNPNAQKGDYALQIIVRDLLSKQTASQSIDFEITQ